MIGGCLCAQGVIQNFGPDGGRGVFHHEYYVLSDVVLEPPLPRELSNVVDGMTCGAALIGRHRSFAMLLVGGSNSGGGPHTVRRR